MDVSGAVTRRGKRVENVSEEDGNAPALWSSTVGCDVAKCSPTPLRSGAQGFLAGRLLLGVLLFFGDSSRFSDLSPHRWGHLSPRASSSPLKSIDDHFGFAFSRVVAPEIEFPPLG